MKITVWTNQPNHFIRESGKLLRERRHGQEKADELLNGQFDGEQVIFTNLSEAQFCAVEDTAVRMGLEYDGNQEETQEKNSSAKAYSLEIQIPCRRPFSPTINTLREKFPYRAGEWFDQVVSDQRAPTGFDLAYIRLVAPLEATQIIYLEHGKTAGFITAYTVNEIASY